MSQRAWVRHLMGMPVSIHVRGPHAAPGVAVPARLSEAVEAAYAELAWVDEVFSRWKPDSQLSRLRRGEVDVADCAPEVAEVLGLCHDASEVTDGAFAWMLPDDDGALRVEPTGLVKGWALERAARPLASLADHAFCLNAGGDIVVGGQAAGPDAGRPWRLGIEDPRNRSQVARVVELLSGAVATSGTAARGAHLIDPATGRPALGEGSVSVVGPSVMWADVWATALFVGPPELACRLAGDPAWQVIRL